MTVLFSKGSRAFTEDLNRLTGENAMLCYQCQRCTLSCPAAYAMRMKPHELMRALQLGLIEEIYWSGTIWTCCSCEACNTRCPQKINVLRLINGLRERSKGLDYYNPQPAFPSFHRLFLGLVERFGRVFEPGLALMTHFLMLTPFKDIDLAAPMLRRGRLKPLPRKSRGKGEIRRVMARIRRMEGSR